VLQQRMRVSRGAIESATWEPEKAARILRGTAFLAGASEGLIRALARIARWRAYAAGQRAFRKGDASDALLVVVAGRLVISSPSPDGNEVILNIIRPGQVVGEIGAIDGGPRTADATAAEPTQALQVMARDVRALLDADPSFGYALLLVLCARLRQTTALVEDAILHDLPARLVHRLQALAAACGRPEPRSASVRIDHALTQEELGDSIGVSRVSVSKQLNAWRARGLLDFGRGFIVVHGMDRLEAAVLER
jgi:CRP/FNR family cyclic AMP-dependent transcriptional regulator